MNETMMKGYNDMAVLAKANMDAMMAATAIVSQGVQNLNDECVAYCKAAMEQSLATVKALIGTKDLRDVVAVQNAYAKRCLDSFLAESTKLSEMGLKVANEALVPLNAQVNVAMTQLRMPVAA